MHYMLTHSGMHAYNGNPNKRRQENKLVKKVAKKINKNLNNTNINRKLMKGIVKYGEKAKGRNGRAKTRKIGPGIPTKFGPTLKYLSLVKNPIHTVWPAKITDMHNQPSYCLNDYYISNNGVAVEGTYDDIYDAYGVVVYLTYGPNGSGQINNVPYQVIMVPTGSSGNPILDSDGNVFRQLTALYDDLLDQVNSMRLVAAGLRINSLIDVSTDSNSQYVTGFRPFQLELADFEKWIAGGSGSSIDNYLLTTNQTALYYNKSGAASRYDPFQDPDQLKYYTPGMLSDTNDEDQFNTHYLKFPGIYVTFSEAIAFDVGLLKVDKNTVNVIAKQKEFRRQQAIMYETLPNSNLNNNLHNVDQLSNDMINLKIDGDEIKSDKQESKTNDNIIDLYYSNGKYYRVHERKQVKADNDGSYIFPIKLEVKFWFEATVEYPSILLVTPSPMDRNFQQVVFWAKDKANFPLTSDGHSFKPLNWVNKRFGNPKRVKRSSQWVSNMVRSTRQGANDIARAFYR